MKNILFIVIPEKGHINPCIGVAQYLKEMGHSISFYAPSDISEQLGRAGFQSFLGPKEKNEHNRGAKFTKSIVDPAWLRNWIKTTLLDSAEDVIPELRRHIKNFDLVVTDPMIYPATIASELEGKRWVALSNSLNPVLNDQIESELLETVEWLSDDRDLLFKKHGLNTKFRGCDALSSYLTIAFTTPELSHTNDSKVCQVGPSMPLNKRGDENEFDWGWFNPELPLVYASFGSQIYHQPELFRKIINAVAEKPVQLLAAVHDLDLEYIPQNVHLCGYGPQLEILKKARVLITHGGANSIMEALATRTPVLINPICNDQFHQVWFVEKAKCGKQIDLGHETAEQVWSAVQWALSADISHVADSYQQNGALKAAELINEL